MADIDKQYHKLCEVVINTGYEYFTDNRPDVPCKQVTSANLEINLQKEFPLLTTKKMFTKGIVEELLWFLRGEDNVKSLNDKGVTIWNKDAYNFYLNWCKEHDSQLVDIESFISVIGDSNSVTNTFGNVGRNYGVQWRHWTNVGSDIGIDNDILKPFDQIQELIANLCKPNPINRRHIVTAWNPAETNDTALPPCHWAFEILPRPLTYAMRIEASGKDVVWLNSLWQEAFSISKDEDAKATLDQELAHIPHYGFVLKWHQRSVDMFLG